MFPFASGGCFSGRLGSPIDTIQFQNSIDTNLKNARTIGELETHVSYVKVLLGIFLRYSTFLPLICNVPLILETVLSILWPSSPV